MRWFAILTLAALILAGCGGGNKAATSTATGGAAAQTTASGGNATAATGAPTAAAVAPTTPTSAPTAAAVAPTAAANAPTAAAAIATAADAKFPDVHVPLKVGSSGEVPSSDPDPTTVNDVQGTVKVTIVAITDPAKTDSPIFQSEAGNHYWAVEVTMQGTGDKTVNTGQWTLHTTAGNEYGTIYLTGVGEDINYGALAAGETKQGVLVFQLPDGATIQWLHMDPSIFVGQNLFFDAS